MKKKAGIDARSRKKTVLEDENEIVEVPIEKKIWDWLSQYGRLLAITFSVLIVAWAVYLMGRAWNRHIVHNHLKDYSAINSLHERVIWAESKHPGTLKNLRGFVFLENAHNHMNNSDFKEAITYFEKAIDFLNVSPLKEQAQVGIAYAYLQNAQPDMAKKMFLELYKSKSKYLRAQALFALCGIAMQEGDEATFEKYKKRLQEYDEGVGFLQKLEVFESVK